MVDYAPGMRTIIRDEEWMVKKIEKNNLGNLALHCIGISPLVKDKEVIFLTDLEDIKIVNPAEVQLIPDISSHFRRTQLYLESQWRQQIPTDTDLHIGDKAAMDLMPYQLEPAEISLRRPRQRILIADTVGLGKTLEAGILMSELIVRGKGKRILVVTVKSMMTQFQKEMWNRFTIPLVGLPDLLNPSEIIYIVAGSIPNKRSTPLVDEWFGLVYENGKYKESLSMNEVLKHTKFRKVDIPNSNELTEDGIKEAAELLPDVVAHAKEHMQMFYRQYSDRMNPLLDEELDKLASLEEKHKHYQLSLFESERKKSEQERKVGELFDKFNNWVTDTLSIQNNPYIRIGTVLRGVSK